MTHLAACSFLRLFSSRDTSNTLPDTVPANCRRREICQTSGGDVSPHFTTPGRLPANASSPLPSLPPAHSIECCVDRSLPSGLHCSGRTGNGCRARQSPSPWYRSSRARRGRYSSAPCGDLGLSRRCSPGAATSPTPGNLARRVRGRPRRFDAPHHIFSRPLGVVEPAWPHYRSRLYSEPPCDCSRDALVGQSAPLNGRSSPAFRRPGRPSSRNPTPPDTLLATFSSAHLSVSSLAPRRGPLPHACFAAQRRPSSFVPIRR